MEKILDRFLRYVAVDTQSDEESESQPSAAKELNLLRMLQGELEAMGVEATLDEWGYVMGRIPSNIDKKVPAVGFIALIGVALQNGIIMISHINHLRERGKGLRTAVVEGASHRMRPVLLTASVAVLGLFPASISTGIGSDVQRPLATVIVYGLIFATIVTLFILPTLYYLMERRHEEKDATPTTPNTPI